MTETGTCRGTRENDDGHPQEDSSRRCKQNTPGKNREKGSQGFNRQQGGTATRQQNNHSRKHRANAATIGSEPRLFRGLTGIYMDLLPRIFCRDGNGLESLIRKGRIVEGHGGEGAVGFFKRGVVTEI